MHTPRDAKAMAKSLRQALSERQIEITHSDSLECVARQFGWRDWNTFSAQLERPVLRSPKDWVAGGSRRQDYDMGVDHTEECALIRYRYALSDAEPEDRGRGSGFGTLMQAINAKDFKGKRVRLSAQLKARDVSGAATIWLRIDEAPNRLLVFDNMETREKDGALTGSVDWQDRSIVLDVPPQGQSIHFGFFLRGTGSMWARKLQLSEVADSVPVTATIIPLKSTPSNLDFADVA